MLFNSYVFWAFFAVVIALYKVLPHRAQNRMLLVASYVFYGYWDYRFLSLIAISTVVDFFVGLGLRDSDDGRHRKRLLTLSIVANLGMLGVFKYYDFFAAELDAMLASMGINGFLPLLRVALPIGISFYTFQTMSYTIDVYRRQTEATSRFLDFALYVAFFPQLVAGPIERSGRLLPQVLRPRVRQPGDFSEGFHHVLIGMFKKVVVADNMAPIVDHVFSRDLGALSGADVLVGVYAFAFQIYGDFSGYSSIAQGIAKWMGFDLMWNFKMPYFAADPSEFWRRWHISLSSWLRDYLYVPLGGNRHGKWATNRNLAVTMLLGGLWHGAGWTFIAWGAFHGLLLVVYRPWRIRDSKPVVAPVRIIRVVIMFHLVCVGWLLFRAESIGQAWAMTGALLGKFEWTDFSLYALGIIAFFAGPLMIMEAWIERSGNLLHLRETGWMVRAAAYAYMIVMLWVFPPLVSQEFIYFQF